MRTTGHPDTVVVGPVRGSVTLPRVAPVRRLSPDERAEMTRLAERDFRADWAAGTADNDDDAARVWAEEMSR